MKLEKYQFFEGLPTDKRTGSFETILQSSGIKIERIVSNGHHSVHDFWYEQEGTEWVLLLSGSAVLLFADRPEQESPTVQVTLVPGEAILIPAGQRHQVASTDPDKPTVWLAIHHESGLSKR